MDLNMVLTDMSGAYIEHSIVITNFVATVYNQLKSSICRVYGDNVQYKWIVNGEGKYDRTEKMELYRQQEVEEYWIVDWRNKTVEIYEPDYENDIPKYFLWKVITEKNKDELRLVHFPHIRITFDELFDGIN